MAAYLQKFATWIGWGALGAIISLAALFLTLDFSKTAVTAFLLSDTNLVDVKNPLNELQVLYNGKDLIKENLSLHLYRVRIQNTGDKVIVKEHFDDNDLWGIRVSSGSIVKVSAPASDSSYIQRNISVHEPDQQTLRFAPIIFEPGDFFTVDFFVLLSTSSEPSHVVPIGKIAGVRQIPVTTSNLNRRSILYEAYWGDWQILALRIIATPVYVIVLGLLIWALVGPVIFIMSQLRRRRVRHILEVNGVDIKTSGVVAIVSLVTNLGRNSIEPIIESIWEIIMNRRVIETGENKVSTDVVNKLLKKRILIKDKQGQLDINSDKIRSVNVITIPEPYGEATIMDDEEEMTKNGILVREDEELRVNEHAVQALTVLAKFYGKKIPDEFAAKASDTARAG